MGKGTQAKTAKPASADNRYRLLIDRIFFERFKPGATSVAFRRTDIEGAAAELGVALPKNLGDVIYSFRFRVPLSDRLLATQPEGMEWRIELAGGGAYRFVLGRRNRIAPNPALVRTKVPDATPEIIAEYALGDEQALLAVVRYNRLIDVFLGVAAYSLQNHLRTTVKGIGQIEIDELYVGLDSAGAHHVVPVQAKRGSDQVSVVQTQQDIAGCVEKFPGLRCRPVSVQFMAGQVIAMFELAVQDGEVRVARESHYQLVPRGELDPEQVRGGAL